MATLQYPTWRIPWAEKPGGLQSMGSQSQAPPRFSPVAASGGYSLVLGAQATDCSGFSAARHRL